MDLNDRPCSIIIRDIEFNIWYDHEIMVSVITAWGVRWMGLPTVRGLMEII